MTDAQIASYPTYSCSLGIIRRSKLPALHLSKTYTPGAHARLDKALSTLSHSLGNKGQVILAGKRGTGKTQMAAWYALTLAITLDGLRTNDTPIVYTTAMDLFTSLRSNQNDPRAAFRYTGAELLIVDEIQVRNETEWERDTLTHLVDKRYGAMKPTLLIGNLLHTQLVESLGNSIVDRCNDGGGVIVCDWDSLRGTI